MHKSGFKGWFTLLELVIVVIILGILLISFGDIWAGVDKDLIKAQTCTNRLEWVVSRAINDWLTQRWIVSGNQAFYPKEYVVRFFVTGIVYLMSWGDVGIKEIQKVVTSGSVAQGDEYCVGTTYRVKQKGNISTLKISFDDKMIVDLFSGNDLVYTGDNKLFYCKIDGRCKPLGKLNFDKRAYIVNYSHCIAYSGGKICTKWTD